MISATTIASGTGNMLDITNIDYKLTTTTEILLTSESGDKLASKDNVVFATGSASKNVIHVRPDVIKQTLNGIGTSFTESSAFVLAHLSEHKRKDVMNQIYSKQGANFSIARTVIGATDFSVAGGFSYDDVKDDKKLLHFSVTPDIDGFSKREISGNQG